MDKVKISEKVAMQLSGLLSTYHGLKDNCDIVAHEFYNMIKQAGYIQEDIKKRSKTWTK